MYICLVVYGSTFYCFSHQVLKIVRGLSGFPDRCYVCHPGVGSSKTNSVKPHWGFSNVNIVQGFTMTTMVEYPMGNSSGNLILKGFGSQYMSPYENGVQVTLMINLVTESF